MLDLGCGCGKLTIASALMGSTYNVGVDIDQGKFAMYFYSSNWIVER